MRKATSSPESVSKNAVATLPAVALFLPAWGAALGLALAILEKCALYGSGSDVSADIYGVLFAALSAAGLAAGLVVAVAALLAMRLQANRQIVLALAGAALIGGAVQAYVTFHPELTTGEGVFLIGADAFRNGLAGLFAAALAAAAVARARKPFAALLFYASAFLTALGIARTMPPGGLLNVASLPLIFFFGCFFLVEFGGKRIPRASTAITILLPAVLIIWSASTSTPPGRLLDRPCERDPGKLAMLSGKPNVVIVILDTLRPDHVSSMGYGRPTTPRIDGFLKSATLYTRTKSVSSWTLSSHGSLFTGLWPRSNGARFADESLVKGKFARLRSVAYPLSPEVSTLAEILREKGYATAGIASNYAWLGKEFGMDRGFDYYFCMPRYRQETLGRYQKVPVSLLLDKVLGAFDRYRNANYNDLKPYYRAPEITGKALAWLKKRPEDPFFLFLNYWDPHIPYNPPAPYDEKFPGKTSPRGMKVDWVRGTFDVMKGSEDVDPRFAAELISQYDGEIAYMDKWVGRLFDGLKEMGLWENTIVIVASDHGESFGEHRYLDHGACLYEDENAILLAVKTAGQSAGRTSDSLVSILDVTPTILDQLGMGSGDAMHGQPLDEVTHPIVAELYPPLGRIEHYGERFTRRLVALYKGDHKLIVSTKGTVELYDLARDPGELVNLYDAETHGDLLDELRHWEETHLPVKYDAPPAIDDATIKKLKSIGYL